MFKRIRDLITLIIQTMFTYLAICLLLGIISAFIAVKKGFNPIIWFFAAGLSLLSFVILLILPSSLKKGLISEHERERLRKNGNLNGSVLLGLVVIILVLQIVSTIAG